MTAIKYLSHLTEDFTLAIADMSQTAIIAAIREAGYTLGVKSLSALLSEEKKEAGDFRALKRAPHAKKVMEETAAEGAEAIAEVDAEEASDGDAAEMSEADIEAAKNAASQAPVVSTKAAPKTKPAVKTLTPEQAALAAEAEATHGATQEPKKGRVAKFHPHLPTSPVGVKKDSVMHRLFLMLCRPEGATKDEMMAEFGWSAGGLAGIIHWEPKAKGYALGSVKRDGKLAYHLELQNSGGRRVKADEVMVKEPKPVPAPKEPKAPKAAAPAPAPKTPKVRVTKEQLGDVPHGAANVTTRRSAKKAQA